MKRSVALVPLLAVAVVGAFAEPRPPASSGLARAARAATTQAPSAPAGEWRTFEGTWSAAGKAHGIAAEGGVTARIVFLSGAVVLTSPQGLSRGFRGEFVAFDDGRALVQGRLAWTDEHGDQLFGKFEGPPLQPGRPLAVTLTGGTGRYEGITGDLSFTWQYVVNAEDNHVQVRTTTLKGRFRVRGDRP